MTADETPRKPAADGTQLGVTKVQTADGERLVVTLAMLLTADQAKAYAAAITREADTMSASGLVTASAGTVLR